MRVEPRDQGRELRGDRPSMTVSSHRCTAASNATSGSCHDVWAAASRIAFSAYACSRPRSSGHHAVTGHTPKMFCQQEHSRRRVRRRSCQRPLADEFRPQRRHLRQHTDAGPHVLAAFGVVGGQRRHRLRPQPGARRRALVKLGALTPNRCGLTAHLVERHQPGVAVEQAVLHRLGGRGAAQLLESHRRLGTGGQRRRDDRERFGQFWWRRRQFRRSPSAAPTTTTDSRTGTPGI